MTMNTNEIYKAAKTSLEKDIRKGEPLAAEIFQDAVAKAIVAAFKEYIKQTQ